MIVAMQNARLDLPSRLRRNKWFAAFAGVVVCLVLVPPVTAQGDPEIVTIVFHSRLPLYELSAAAERTISERAAAICSRKFPHWQFKAGNDVDFPQLRIELTRLHEKAFLAMSLIVAAGQPPAESYIWREEVFGPGDLALRPVMPREQDASEFFPRTFEDRILSNPATLRDVLAKLSEAVPVGKVVILIVPHGSLGRPRAVLPIKWSDHCRDFADSEFVIYSRTGTNESVKLFSVGLSQPLDYKPGQKQFDGVGVQVNAWQRAGDSAPRPLDASGRIQMPNLIPLEFHLKEAKPYFLPCNPGASSAPAVAP